MILSRFSFIFFCILLLTGAGCAVQTSPMGGPPDKTPPKIERAKPLNQTLNFKEKSITIHTDSYLKPVTYGKEVFISPLLNTPPKISVFDRRIVIKFQDTLRPNTTYVVTCSDLTDNFSGQKTEQQFTYAFSTGSVLDSMKITGKVIDGVTGVGEKEMSVLLFDTDSIKGNDFFGKRPDYLAKTDASGQFVLSNLKKKKYRIFSLKDNDQSNTFNQKNEKIGLDTIPFVVFGDTGSSVVHTIISFTQDEQPPLLKGYEWTGKDALLTDWSENVLTDSIRIFISDTLKTHKTRIQDFVILSEKKQLFFQMPRTRQEYSTLIFENIKDSLNNRSDTSLFIVPKNIMNLKEKPLLQKPVYRFDSLRYEWLFAETLPDSLLSYIYVTDSAGRTLSKDSVSLIAKGLKGSLSFRYPGNLPSKMRLKMKGEIFAQKDTVFSFPVPLPDSAQYGTLNGKVVTEGYEGKIVLILNTGGGAGKSKENTAVTGTTYVLYNRNFDLKNMPPGAYSVKVIFDADGNGCWTPGSLKSGRLPEKIYSPKETISIRANWDLDKQEIIAPFVSRSAEGGGKGGGKPLPAEEKKEGKK
ncbi:MAG: Ig-like domain-containing protein [Bacteroidia bacterium]|nr:Ig-like domain-containing protein [Bacteroidia bacterium]